jgi:hypothetical protein
MDRPSVRFRPVQIRPARPPVPQRAPANLAIRFTSSSLQLTS